MLNKLAFPTGYFKVALRYLFNLIFLLSFLQHAGVHMEILNMSLENSGVPL